MKFEIATTVCDMYERISCSPSRLTQAQHGRDIVGFSLDCLSKATFRLLSHEKSRLLIYEACEPKLNAENRDRVFFSLYLRASVAMFYLLSLIFSSGLLIEPDRLCCAHLINLAQVLHSYALVILRSP